MEINISKYTLLLAIGLVFWVAVPLRADDNQNNNSGDNNIQQASQSDGGNNQNSGEGSGNNNSGDGNGNGNNGDQSGGGVAVSGQSSADPYGLKKAGLVMQSGSDANAKDFNENALPEAIQFINKSDDNSKSSALTIDPSKIALATKTAVRAYFISGDTAFQNALGIASVASGRGDSKNVLNQLASSTSKLIFSDTSGKSGGSVKAGDFVNVGTFDKGSKLDFFLIASGNNQSSAAYSTSGSANQDGLQQHVSAFVLPRLNSPYVFLSFQNLWGSGDKNINNTIVALDIGQANVKAMLATPEPASWLTLGSFLALAAWAKLRMDRQAPVLA